HFGGWLHFLQSENVPAPANATDHACPGLFTGGGSPKALARKKDGFTLITRRATIRKSDEW
ncbi:MAG TPA: hypothetical protein VFI31_04420, partial [Pirellulales bacterium]|nr:hypothetical protein [Pirellulales bacterium]